MGVHVLQDQQLCHRPQPDLRADRRRRPTDRCGSPRSSILNSRPSLIAKGVLSDDHLADELPTGGRLTALLDAADTDDRRFAVDPALIEELQTMKAGYQVRQADGSTAPAPVRPRPSGWLDDFDELTAERDGYRLPYGSPDLAALTHDRQRAPIRAERRGRQARRARPRPAAAGLPGRRRRRRRHRGDRRAARTRRRSCWPTQRQRRRSAAGRAGRAGQDDPPIVSYTVGEPARLGGGPGPDPRTPRRRSSSGCWPRPGSRRPPPTDDAVRGRVRVITTRRGGQGRRHGDRRPVAASRPPCSELLDTVPQAWDQKFRYPASARAPSSPSASSTG